MGAKYTLQISQDLYINLWVDLHDYGLRANNYFHYPQLAPRKVVFLFERGGGKHKYICLTRYWVITLEAELHFFVQLQRTKAVKFWRRDKEIYNLNGWLV